MGNERIEELVAKRVEEELERRREEIETEVLKRVEEAKKIMEKQMMEELEKRKNVRRSETRGKKLVAYGSIYCSSSLNSIQSLSCSKQSSVTLLAVLICDIIIPTTVDFDSMDTRTKRK